MSGQNSDDLCSHLLKLSKEIRFAGIIDRMGSLVSGGMKDGIQSLEKGEESLKLYLGYAINNIMREDFDSAFGKVLYSISEREKIKLATFPYGDNILLVSMSRNSPHPTIVQNILEILRK